jgi:hypothetical protein
MILGLVPEADDNSNRPQLHSLTNIHVGGKIEVALILIKRAAPIWFPSPETPRGWDRHYPNQLGLSAGPNRAAITNSMELWKATCFAGKESGHEYQNHR